MDRWGGEGKIEKQGRNISEQEMKKTDQSINRNKYDRSDLKNGMLQQDQTLRTEGDDQRYARVPKYTDQSSESDNNIKKIKNQNKQYKEKGNCIQKLDLSDNDVDKNEFLDNIQKSNIQTSKNQTNNNIIDSHMFIRKRHSKSVTNESLKEQKDKEKLDHNNIKQRVNTFTNRDNSNSNIQRENDNTSEISSLNQQQSQQSQQQQNKRHQQQYQQQQQQQYSLRREDTPSESVRTTPILTPTDYNSNGKRNFNFVSVRKSVSNAKQQILPFIEDVSLDRKTNENLKDLYGSSSHSKQIKKNIHLDTPQSKEQEKNNTKEITKYKFQQFATSEDDNVSQNSFITHQKKPQIRKSENFDELEKDTVDIRQIKKIKKLPIALQSLSINIQPSPSLQSQEQQQQEKKILQLLPESNKSKIKSKNDIESVGGSKDHNLIQLEKELQSQRIKEIQAFQQQSNQNTNNNKSSIKPNKIVPLKQNRPQYYQGLEQFQLYTDKQTKDIKDISINSQDKQNDFLQEQANSKTISNSNTNDAADMQHSKDDQDTVNNLQPQEEDIGNDVNINANSPRTIQAMKIVGVSVEDISIKTKKQIKEESQMAIKTMAPKDQMYYVDFKYSKLQERRTQLTQKIVQERRRILKDNYISQQQKLVQKLKNTAQITSQPPLKQEQEQEDKSSWEIDEEQDRKERNNQRQELSRLRNTSFDASTEASKQYKKQQKSVYKSYQQQQTPNSNNRRDSISNINSPSDNSNNSDWKKYLQKYNKSSIKPTESISQTAVSESMEQKQEEIKLKESNKAENFQTRQKQKKSNDAQTKKETQEKTKNVISEDQKKEQEEVGLSILEKIKLIRQQQNQEQKQMKNKYIFDSITHLRCSTSIGRSNSPKDNNNLSNSTHYRKTGLLQNIIDQETILRQQKEKQRIQRFNKLKSELQKQENIKFKKDMLEHERKVREDNILRKHEQIQEDAKQKKQRMLSEHKRRCIEEKIQVELAQQRNKQVEQARQAQKEQLLQKIQQDNIRLLALQRYKSSVLQDKQILKQALDTQKEKIDLQYEKDITNFDEDMDQQTSRLSERNLNKNTHRSSSNRNRQILSNIRTGSLALSRSQQKYQSVDAADKAASSPSTTKAKKSSDKKKRAFDSSIGISHEHFFPVLEFSSIGYVSDFNIMNQEQTEQFLIQLAQLETNLINSPTTLMKDAFMPLVQFAEEQESEIFELRNLHNHLKIFA